MAEEEKKPNLLDLFREMLDDHLPKSEFTKAFKEVVDYVTRTDKNLTAEMKQAIKNLEARHEELRGSNQSEFETERARLTSDIRELLESAQTRIDIKLKAIDQRASELRDGVDADPEYVISQVLSRIPPTPPPATITAIRDELENMEGDEAPKWMQAIVALQAEIEELKKRPQRVGGAGWGAHPLAVAKSGAVKTKVTRHINFTGSGVSSVTHNADGTTEVNISGGGGGVNFETPTGSVNGSNTTFTVANTPAYIIVDGIVYFENNGYTLAGLTITTTVPPTGFIRSAY